MGDCESDESLENQASRASKEPKSFHSLNCPNSLSSGGSPWNCLLTEQPDDQKNMGVKYETCNFSGDDYRICPRMLTTERILENASGVLPPIV